MARAAMPAPAPVQREPVIMAVMPVLAIGGILLRLISGRLSARDERGQSVHFTLRFRPSRLWP
jgi:hypothetical protein